MITLDELIRLALEEDIGKKDLTTELLVPEDLRVKARIIAKEEGVIAGLEVAEKVFKNQKSKIKSQKLRFCAKVKDGERIKKGEVVAEIEGKARTVITAERVVLNFLGHLSGIATLTRKYVDAIKSGTRHKVHPAPNLVRGKRGTRIYDTRKTTPLWRELEKYAVHCGGGYNHRMNLSEQVLIKDNHLKKISNIKYQISNIRKKIEKKIKIEIEAENLEQVEQALDAGVDIIMLDNMTFSEMKKAIGLVHRSSFTVHRNRPEIEVSGGVNLKDIKKIVRLGVERISVGEITHSAPALDLSLEVRR